MDKNTKARSGNLLEAMIKLTKEKKVFNSYFSKKIDETQIYVIKEKGNYILVKEANNPVGYERYSKHNFKSLNGAINNINLLITEAEKYVIKEPIPASSVDDMGGADDFDMDSDSEEVSLDDDEMSAEEDQGEAIETDLSEYQELAGKLAYILKDEADELDDYDATVKYVFNTLLASLKIDTVSPELLDSIKEKLTKNEDTPEEPTDEVVEQYVHEMAKKKGYVVESVFKDKTLLKEYGEEDSPWDDYSLTDKQVQYDKDQTGLPYYMNSKEDLVDDSLDDDDDDDFDDDDSHNKGHWFHGFDNYADYDDLLSDNFLKV